MGQSINEGSDRHGFPLLIGPYLLHLPEFAAILRKLRYGCKIAPGCQLLRFSDRTSQLERTTFFVSGTQSLLQ